MSVYDIFLCSIFLYGDCVCDDFFAWSFCMVTFCVMTLLCDILDVWNSCCETYLLCDILPVSLCFISFLCDIFLCDIFLVRFFSMYVLLWKSSCLVRLVWIFSRGNFLVWCISVRNMIFHQVCLFVVSSVMSVIFFGDVFLCGIFLMSPSFIWYFPLW